MPHRFFRCIFGWRATLVQSRFGRFCQIERLETLKPDKSGCRLKPAPRKMSKLQSRINPAAGWRL